MQHTYTTSPAQEKFTMKDIPALVCLGICVLITICLAILMAIPVILEILMTGRLICVLPLRRFANNRPQRTPTCGCRSTDDAKCPCTLAA